MNVQGVISSYVVKTYDAKVSKAGKTPETEVPKPAREKVEVSKYSDEISTIKQFIDALPDVRIQAVEEIEEKIKNNDYPIENRMNDAFANLVSEGILQNL